MQVALDTGNGDIDDGDIEQSHEEAKDKCEQRQPGIGRFTTHSEYRI